jgi:plastocyanin
MFSNGAMLSGISGINIRPASEARILGDTMGRPLNTKAAGGSAASTVEVVDGVQVVTSELEANAYPAITVQAGMPVRWVISAADGSINGCNNALSIPAYNVEHEFHEGENIIEFTPQKPGVYSYSCWMGMIVSSITVT